jgi:hypothetical protein
MGGFKDYLTKLLNESIYDEYSKKLQKIFNNDISINLAINEDEIYIKKHYTKYTKKEENKFKSEIINILDSNNIKYKIIKIGAYSCSGFDYFLKIKLI